jgi:ATP-dependent DNA helicase RecG
MSETKNTECEMIFQVENEKPYDKNIFEFTDNTVYVQLPFDKEVIESRGKSRGKILELIKNDSKISVAEIAEIVGLSIKGVEKNIRQLKREGIIVRTTDTKNGEWISLVS